jgi:porin
MYKLPRHFHLACLSLFMTAVFSVHSAYAQDEYEWQEEALPDWVEDLGYDEGRSDDQSGTDAVAHGSQSPNGYERCGCDCIRCRSGLTGDWFGCRSCWQESGIIFRGTVTQFGFGVAGGIKNPAALAGPVLPLGFGDRFQYTGRGEYDWIVDLEKFGGLPHGKLLVGVQHWYGEFGNVSFNTGALPPPVFASLLPPQLDRSLYLTDFLITQPLSERLILFAGKKNVVGTADQDIFAGGDGTDQFINQALVANPAFMLALPYSSFMAGAVMPRQWGSLGLSVMDPQDRTDQAFSRLGDLFSKGVIVSGQVKVNTNLLGKPGEHHVGAIWKHVDLIDVSQFPPPPTDYPYPPVPPGVPTKPDSYTIYYGFDQYFQVFPGQRPGLLPVKRPRGWGLFGRASISDGNPTPFDHFCSQRVIFAALARETSGVISLLDQDEIARSPRADEVSGDARCASAPSLGRTAWPLEHASPAFIVSTVASMARG